MASITLSPVAGWAVGETISAYERDTRNVAVGSAVATAVVGADSTTTFTGLTAETKYIATDGTHEVRFGTHTDPVTGGGTSTAAAVRRASLSVGGRGTGLYKNGVGYVTPGGQTNTHKMPVKGVGWARDLFVTYGGFYFGSGVTMPNEYDVRVSIVTDAGKIWPATFDGTDLKTVSPRGLAISEPIGITAVDDDVVQVRTFVDASALGTISTTNGSPLASAALPSLGKFRKGQEITGAGIPASTTILQVNGPFLTLSAAATATASDVPVEALGRVPSDWSCSTSTTEWLAGGDQTQTATGSLPADGPVSGTLTLADGSNIATGLTGTLTAGMIISGTGIPLGTAIVRVNGTTATLSRYATADGTDVAITGGKYENDNITTPLSLLARLTEDPDQVVWGLGGDSNQDFKDYNGITSDGGVGDPGGDGFGVTALGGEWPYARQVIAGGGITGYQEANWPDLYFRLAEMAGCTHWLDNSGTNDFAGFATGADYWDVKADYITQLAQRGVRQFVICTIPPHTSNSHDPASEGTPSEQSTQLGESVRVEHNDILRDGTDAAALAASLTATLGFTVGIWAFDLASYIEVADDTEVLTLNGGKWKAGESDGGTHMTSEVAQMLADALRDNGTNHFDTIAALSAATTPSNGLTQADLVPPTPAAPVNTVAPAITPTTCAAGATLTCSTGTWTGFPVPTYTYQWTADAGDITGETASTYVTVDPDDVDVVIGCTVTATNTQGSASEPSSNTVTPSVPSGIDAPDAIFGADLAQWQNESTLGSNGSDITSWTDSAGNSNAMIQYSGGSVPVVATVNGHKVARSSIAGDRLARSYTSAIVQPCEVFMVCKKRTALDATYRSFYTGFSPGNLVKAASTDIGFNAGVSLITTDVSALAAITDDFHAWHFVSNGASSAIRLDNVTVIAGDGGTNQIDSFTIGMDWSSNPNDMDYAEIVVISRTSTSGERDSMQTYLAALVTALNT